MSVKIRDNDKRYRELKKNLGSIKRGKPRVAVGVIGSEASEPHEGDGDGQVTVVDVASWNEFGTDRIPARSFLRSTFEEDKAKFLSLLRRGKMKLVRGEASRKQVLSMVGFFAQKQVQRKITAGGSPFIPNSPATVDQKGSSSPLIDTGQLRQSITFEVRDAD